MTRSRSLLPELLVCLLGLAACGCGGRGERSQPQISERPPEATLPPTPSFDADAVGSRPGIRSGDLPLGEEPVDMSRYREPEAVDEPELGYVDPAVLEDVYFEFDSYGLTSATREALTRIGAWMLANPRAVLVIEGHCDARGTAAYNLVLGEKRALSVREFLAAMRIAPGRLTTVSFGEERPAEQGRGEAVWSRNRRAHFRVAQAQGSPSDET